MESLLPTVICRKCGCELNRAGYCLDDACPYNDWPQQILLRDMEELCAIKIEEKYGIRKRPSRDRE